MGKQSNFYPAFPISTMPVGNQMINGGESLYKGSQLIHEDGVTDKNTVLLLNVWIHAGLPTSQIRDNQTARASWWEGPKIFFERVLQKMSQENDQISSSVQSCLILWDPMDRQASLSITNSGSLLKLMSIELVTPSNYLILCRPRLLLPSVRFT